MESARNVFEEMSKQRKRSLPGEAESESETAKLRDRRREERRCQCCLSERERDVGRAGSDFDSVALKRRVVFSRKRVQRPIFFFFLTSPSLWNCDKNLKPAGNIIFNFIKRV